MKTKKVTPVTKKEVQTKDIDLSKLTNQDILEMNFDEVNLYDLLEKNELLKKQVSKATKDRKDDLYKNIPSGLNGKKFRQKIRKSRNKHMTNIINDFQQKNKESLKKSIDSFDKFYKENYSLNDYSFESLSRSNCDADTKVNLKLFLHIVKQHKAIN